MTLRVTRIARTHCEPVAFDILPRSSADVTDIDHLPELAGRRCYRSEHRPRPATAANRDYVENVLDLGHLSVFAHAHVAYLVEDTSRLCTHELIRSVFLAYSQESTRYVQPRLDAQPVIPADADEDDAASLVDEFHRGMAQYRTRYDRARARGLSAKRAAGLARNWAPQTIPTSLVVSGNVRAWRDFIAQRATLHAEAEIRALALMLLDDLLEIAPNTFADLDALAETARHELIAEVTA